MSLLPARLAACKFDYEFLGRSKEDLSRTYELTQDQIDFHIIREGWQRKVEPMEIAEVTDLKTYAEQITALAKSKLTILSVARQIEHQPLIAQLEKLCLEKAIELLNEVHPIDPRGPTKLKTLVQVIQIIQEHSPISLGAELQKQLTQNPGLVVNIVNQIQ